MVLGISLSTLIGCAGPQVVPAGPDTYSVSAGGGLGWTPSSAPVRAKVYQAANDYCTKRGLIMVPISVDQRPGQIGRHTASMELVFRALPPGDPEIRRPSIERPDHIQRNEIRY
jgi:hypothetical protein